MVTTTTLGELKPLGEAKPIQEAEIEELEQARLEWAENRTLCFAAEFASTALVVRLPGEAVDAAEFILKQSSVASPATLALAREILSGMHVTPASLEGDGEAETGVSARAVNLLRRRLRREPRNAVAWTDLARAHATLGQQAKAGSAMKVALALAPENRFVLRAGVRLLVVRGDAGAAHSLLMRSEATKRDPWLAAAEIGVASVSERNPRLVRTGRHMIESKQFSPPHLTELESVLGTLELQAGQDRRARRLFRASLEAPNDNSLAQAEWASHYLVGLDLSEYELREPYAYEARARFDFDEGEWKSAVDEAWQWHYDQPFVNEGSIFGSYTAAVGLMDFAEAARLARAGLRSNPGDAMLLNNLAYALLEMGELEDATKVISEIRQENLGRRERVVDTATRGLLAYKLGDLARGRELYRMSIALAQKEGWTDLASMGSLILARQELSVRGEEAAIIAGSALRLSQDADDAGVRVWREWLLDQLGQRPHVDN